MTGKGDRWGRDRLGRSEPAFPNASTTSLPPLTCTVRQEAGRRHRQLLFRCEAGHLWPFVLRPVPGGESAGCVCLQCLVLQALFACSPLPAMPTALISSCPRSSLLAPVQFTSVCFAPVSVHVRQDRISKTNMFASCKTVPLAATTRACSGGPCAGSI